MKCHLCDEYYCEEEFVTLYDGEQICQYCAEDGVTKCTECEELFFTDDVSTICPYCEEDAKKAAK